LKGYGIMEGNCAISAAYVALKYLKGIEKSDLSHITKIIYEKTAGSMDLDYSTVRNLELLESLHNNNNTKSCLIEIIDNSKTPMGKRILRNWLIKPLINLSKIEERQYFVSKLIEYIKRNNTENPLDLNLRKIVDIERIGGRIGMQTSNPRDIIALKNSLKCIKIILEDIKDLFQVDNTKIIYELEETMKVCESFIVNTELAILEEPSVDINSADIFKSEFNSEISTLRNLRTNGNEWLLNYQNQQIKLTNIPNLKVKFNNVFGYFIEISNSNKDKVPENYIRKQTLVNAERFITTELKEMEDKILNSSDRLIDLEKKLFIDFRLNLLQYVVPFQKISKIIGALDVFYSFAILGASDKYVIPKLVKSTEPILKINNLRHPIVEYKTGSKYVPNDIDLSEKTLVLLTGPNMSGKSTYIRSIAIVVIMAQMGCVVPADECVLSLVDKVFTRIGASDNLATGESTFMVEMNETANILNNATKDSLVVLDEVGRGTSTYDGLAIAFSVVKYLHEELKCRALFATHYHELTKLETKFDRIINLNVSVFEDKDNIIFMHKIIPGFAKKSFGIHVAKLAGIPNSVLMDAQNILKQLEKSQSKISNISNKSNMKIEEDLYDNFLLDNL
jgi:DNA mismatch repair protein MutS